tara:strand:- start:32 stop:490 length:459 start_codon:yes stop_codon:yes gene_type:complete
MKTTKEELIRIIEQEVNKVRVKGPLSQNRLVPDFPKDIPSSDIATGVVELYRSVDAISTSIMQISARIDGLVKVVKELAEDVKRNRAMHQVKKSGVFDYANIDPEDPYIEGLQDQINIISELVYTIVDGLPEDIVADIEAAMPPEEEEEDKE